MWQYHYSAQSKRIWASETIQLHSSSRVFSEWTKYTVCGLGQSLQPLLEGSSGPWGAYLWREAIEKIPNQLLVFPRGKGKKELFRNSNILKLCFFSLVHRAVVCLFVPLQSWWVRGGRAFVVIVYPPFLTGFPSKGLLWGNCIATLQSLSHSVLQKLWLKATHCCLRLPALYISDFKGKLGVPIFQPKWLPKEATRSSSLYPSQAFQGIEKGFGEWPCWCQASSAVQSFTQQTGRKRLAE